MTRRKKMKPWKKALLITAIVLASAILAFPLTMIGYTLLMEAAAGLGYCLACKHRLNPPVSAELVSQDKPLVFFELMEELPKIEGIRVRLTYKDGKSEVVDAYDMDSHDTANHSRYHDIGMFYAPGLCQPHRPPLEPGLRQIPLYCVDRIGYYGPGYPSDAFCMVEVYAQTPEEYLAEHDTPFVTVTESSEGTAFLEQYGDCLAKLLVEESGTYALTIDGACAFDESAYIGGGVLFHGLHRTETADYDPGASLERMRNPDYEPVQETEYVCYYARLNAGEPMFLHILGTWDEGGSNLRASMERLPEVTIALGETVTVAQPTVLRIKDYDESKAWPDEWQDYDAVRTGRYILAGEDCYHRNVHDWVLGFVRREGWPAWDGHVIIPHEGKAAEITLRLGE